ncbi:MAG: Hpt domain-containing protein [Frankiales bacterium]|nr:Hpt domain-containing protein [Frankiales bacterium]
MTATAFDAALSLLWASFTGLARSRVADLDAYVAARAAGQDAEPQRAAATVAAHKLAGALGSYGRGGSDEASRLEALLRTGPAPDPLEVVALVAVLRAEVDR